MDFRTLVGAYVRDVILNSFIASPLLPSPARWRLLRACGMNVRRAGIMARGFYGGRRITIGDGTFLNYGVFLDNAAQITIGAQCWIGQEVFICTGTHEVGGPEKRARGNVAAPVAVGDGVWIGARAMIMPGVTVASGCVIAAGAVVTEDTEPNGMYAGVPARRKAELPT